MMNVFGSGTAVFDRARQRRSFEIVADRIRRWPLLAIVLLASTVGNAMTPSTTTASAATFHYDVPVVARVEVDAIGTTDARSAQLSASQDGSASTPPEVQVTSTTPLWRSNATNTAPIESGNYVVSTPRGEYVGQSGNISNRLDQHVASGKFTQAEVNAAQRIAVPGSKLDREIAEQLLIDSKGGVPNLLNVVNPVGPKRFGVMPNQPYVR
jgi:hypothetical protein